MTDNERQLIIETSKIIAAMAGKEELCELKPEMAATVIRVLLQRIDDLEAPAMAVSTNRITLNEEM